MTEPSIMASDAEPFKLARLHRTVNILLFVTLSWIRVIIHDNCLVDHKMKTKYYSRPID